MILNILFIIITTIFLYKKRIAYYDPIINESNPDNLYNRYLMFTIVSQCILNVITNLMGCSSNFSEVGYVILYTLIAWISFVIIVSCKQYLRIPMANVFGYFWYYTILAKAFKGFDCQPELETALKQERYTPLNLDVFDISTSLIHNDVTNVLKYIKGDIKFDIKTCVDIIKACGKRDVFGELILFLLSGIMCVFMAEYILTNNTCKNKIIPTQPTTDTTTTTD